MSESSSDKQYIYSTTPVEVTKVTTSGEQGEFIHFGNQTFLRSDIQYAFGGTFNVGVTKTPKLKLGNPSPMGLFAFATTTLILSFINAGSRGVQNSSVMLGCALFYGGIVQIIAGVWELVVENTFGATVFTAYGGFWLSFGVITMDGFNIISSYKDPKELSNALALYLLAWALVTLLFTMCTLRSTVAMFSLLFSLTITFILLASSNFASANGAVHISGNLTTAAGVFGCITAAFAFYNGMAGILNRENSWIEVKPVFMPGAIRPPSSPSAHEEA